MTTEQMLIMLTSLAAAGLIVGLILMIMGLRQAAATRALAAQNAAMAEALAAKLDALAAEADRTERTLREEFARGREEASGAGRQLREEVGAAVKNLGELMISQLTALSALQERQLGAFAEQLATLTRANEQRFELMRETIERKLTDLQAAARLEAQHNREDGARAREESAATLAKFGEALVARFNEFTQLNQGELRASRELLEQRLTALGHEAGQQALVNREEQGRALKEMRETIEQRLTTLQTENAQKLEQMRQTVDEKLHATLEQRLGESFKLVSERLELVHRGLGEMQLLASGVGDLKKVLTNIKTRGNWGEVQLGNLLEQMLTPDQYGVNVAVNPDSAERVEFAVRLPGRDEEGKPVWLPIDAKFPQEDYQRLVDAAELGDADAVARCTAALEACICGEADKIRKKYICPPHTTDFAVMFLPTEGLFAEVLRRPGLCDRILHDHRIVLAGPTTLAAVLSSLQMGFRTLAIEKRSSEVWQVLGAVKSEFTKFGDVLDKVQKKIQEAGNVIDQAKVRSRAVERKLRGVEQPDAESPVPLLAEAGLFDSADN